MNYLDQFGRRCLAWPAAVLGGILTTVAGALLRFAGWMMDYDLDELFPEDE